MGRLVDAVTFGPRRRRREMERRLRALDRLDALDRGVRPTRSRGRWRGAIAVGVAVAVVAVAAPSTIRSLVPWVDRWGDGTAEAEAPPDGGYTFMRTQRDGRTPVRWETCEPIHFVTSGKAPAGAETLVAEAVAEVEAATGLTFVDEGASRRQPHARPRASWLPSVRALEPPVLVAWTTPDRVPELEGDVVGLGGPTGTTRPSGDMVWIGGAVSLDRPAFVETLARAPRGEAVEGLRAVVVHELGHLLGLGHATDPTQLMHASTGVTRWGAGDLAGLARVAPPCDD